MTISLAEFDTAAAAGAAAAAAGDPITVCPYAAQATPVERAAAAAWVRGYLDRRPPAPTVVDYDGADPQDGAEDVVARHLPGRHNQQTHGHRYNTPGDKSSGLRKVIEHAAHAAEHAGRGRTRARGSAGHDTAQFSGMSAEEILGKRRMYSGHHHDDRLFKNAEDEFRVDHTSPGALERYLDAHAAAVEDRADRATVPNDRFRYTAIPRMAAADPKVFAALLDWQNAERRRWLAGTPRTVPTDRESGDTLRRVQATADAEVDTARKALDAAVTQAEHDDSRRRAEILASDVSDDRLVNALPTVADESSLRAVHERLTPRIPRDTPPAVRGVAEQHRQAQIEQDIAESLVRQLGSRRDYAFGSRSLDEATPAQREALRQEVLRLYEQIDHARDRARLAGMATVNAANAEKAARQHEQHLDQQEGERVLAEVREQVGALPDADVDAKAAGKAIRKELGIPSATALKKAERSNDQAARLRAYAGQSVIRETEDLAHMNTTLIRNRTHLEQLRQRLARGGLRPGVRAALVRLIVRYENAISGNLASIEHHERNLADARARWLNPQEA